jgi:small subunit ribosomal protein S10
MKAHQSSVLEKECTKIVDTEKKDGVKVFGLIPEIVEIAEGIGVEVFVEMAEKIGVDVFEPIPFPLEPPKRFILTTPPVNKKARPRKLRISVKAYQSNILDKECTKIVDTAKKSGVKVVGPIPLPTKLRRYCVLTSPHVNKDARDHFEIRTHKRIVDIYEPTESTIQSLKELDILAGVGLEVKNFQ